MSGQKGIFKPKHHIPKYSWILLKSLTTPLLAYFAVIGNTIMFGSAYFFFYFENGINPNVTSYGDAVWWALCTISTVGYGDIYPITLMGKFIAAFLIIVGITFFLSFMAILVTSMNSILADESNK